MGNCCGKTQNHREEEVEMNSPTADMQKVYYDIIKKIKDVIDLKKSSSEVERILKVPGYLGSFAKIVEYEKSKECDRTVLMKICDKEYSKVIGLEAIIDALVGGGCDVHKQNKKGETALFLATRANNLSAIEALLKHNASPNTSDNDRKYNTFHLAALYGYDEVTESLLDYGLEKKDIDAQSIDGSTPLILAIHHENFNVAEMLINKGRTNVKLCDNNGTTALHEAARNNVLGIVKLLLEDGANVSSKDKNGKTALDLAKEKGHSEIVKIINSVSVDNPREEIQTSKYQEVQVGKKPTVEEFFSAIKRGDLNQVKELTRKGANVNAKDNTTNGSKPIHVAALEGHKNIIEFFLNNGVSIDDTDKHGWTSLHYGTYYGYLEVAKFLLDNGANINAQATDGRKPIHVAAQYGHKNVIEFLISKGVNVDDFSHKDWTPLHYAAWYDQPEVAKFLLDKGANINAKDNIIDGRKPIHVAAQHGHKNVIEFFLSKGVNVDDFSNNDWTPLYYAASEGLLDAVKFLIDRGANIHAKATDGKKPIHVAAREGHKNVIEFFLNNGVSIDDTNKNGWTPLLYAASEGLLDVVKFLIDRGANVHAKNASGKKPIDIAKEKNYQSIVELLSSPYKHTTQSASNPASYLNNVLENDKFEYRSARRM